jgi:hypothetical protein
MFPLIPLALSLAPEIGKWLFGDTGEKTATAVASVVSAVTGTSDPAASAQAIAADPNMAADLRIKLAEIAALREKAQRESDLAALSAQFADVAGARAQTTDLARAGSSIAWGAPVVSVVVLLTFGGVMFLALSQSLPSGSETLLNMLLGSLAAMATSVVGYWVGSSAGSREKTAMIYNSTPQLPGPPT